jgi:hypothetical protein
MGMDGMKMMAPHGEKQWDFAYSTLRTANREALSAGLA